MSLATDILFEPIEPNSIILPSYLDSHLVNVSEALLGKQEFEFSVEPSSPIEYYDKIADLVTKDTAHNVHVLAMVGISTVSRPPNALGIKDVFRRIHAGQTKFFHCGKANSGGAVVAPYELANRFGIKNRLPWLELKGGPVKNCFEWWAASLLPDHTGYHNHYSFATEDEARKYYTTTP